ncbi:MAG: hypothetical protein GX434_18455 [Peptococcaceae bacterium]|nr:hypothetical protein [Peptococcaceae bacterium]
MRRLQSKHYQTCQLGNNSNDGSSIPVQVQGLADVKKVSAGWAHSLAVKTDNTLWTWGDNWVGQLGNRSKISSNIPLKVGEGIQNLKQDTIITSQSVSTGQVLGEAMPLVNWENSVKKNLIL